LQNQFDNVQHRMDFAVSDVGQQLAQDEQHNGS